MGRSASVFKKCSVRLAVFSAMSYFDSINLLQILDPFFYCCIPKL